MMEADYDSLIPLSNVTNFAISNAESWPQNSSSDVSFVSISNSAPANVTVNMIIMEYPDFSQLIYIRMAFIVLFVTASTICVFGNALVVLTVYRNKAMHSPVNYYIVNLGVCDFLVGSAVLPTKLFELLTEVDWNFLDSRSCTVVRFAETVCVFASIYTLVAICVERYYAVVYPVHSRMQMSHSRTGRVIAIVWILPIILAAPNLYPAKAELYDMTSEFGRMTRKFCADQYSSTFRKVYFFSLFLFVYVIPLIIIGVTCISITRALVKKIPVQSSLQDNRAIALEKGRRKVAKMVLVLVAAFIVCRTPYFAVTMVTQIQTRSFFLTGNFFFTMLCINLMAFINSCVNPIVYCAMSSRFRQGFLGIIHSITKCSRKSSSTSSSSNSSVRATTVKMRQIHLLTETRLSSRKHGYANVCNGFPSISLDRSTSINNCKETTPATDAYRCRKRDNLDTQSNFPKDTWNFAMTLVASSSGNCSANHSKLIAHERVHNIEADSCSYVGKLMQEIREIGSDDLDEIFYTTAV